MSCRTWSTSETFCSNATSQKILGRTELSRTRDSCRVSKDNHPAIIDRETFEKVHEKIKASYEFNPAAHRIVKPSCLSVKIICGKYGAHFVKGATRTNRHDGLQEHWFCYGKIHKRTYDARNFRGYRLRLPARCLGFQSLTRMCLPRP